MWLRLSVALAFEAPLVKNGETHLKFKSFVGSIDDWPIRYIHPNLVQCAFVHTILIGS